MRLRNLLLAAAGYVVIGLVVPALASGAAARAGRIAAFGVSLVLFFTHIAVALRRRDPVASAAGHAAGAVALASLVLAAKANVTTHAAGRPLHLSSLVVWPLLTGVTSLLVALAIGAVWARSARPAE